MEGPGQSQAGIGTTSPRAWLVVGMLLIFQTYNFFSKLAFGGSAIPLMHEFSLSPKQFGLIGAYFFLFFAVGGTLVGLFVIGRLPIKMNRPGFIGG